MYLFNVFILLLNTQIQHKSLVRSKTHSILFTTIDDIDFADYRDDNVSIPSDNDSDNSFISINSANNANSNKYKKLNGYDQRYNNTIEEFINHKRLINKIEGFFINKKLLDKLIKIIKQRNESLNEPLNEDSINNSIVYHQYESDIFEQIRQYNNDNRNKSILTHDIFAGGLINDW